MDLTSGDATLLIDPQSGLLREARHQLVTLLEGASGLFDLALPLADELPHRLSATGQDKVSSAVNAQGELRLQYDSLRSARDEFQVSCTPRIRPEAGSGFAMQLAVINHTSQIIPQVLFPYLEGFR